MDRTRTPRLAYREATRALAREIARTGEVAESTRAEPYGLCGEYAADMRRLAGEIVLGDRDAQASHLCGWCALAGDLTRYTLEGWTAHAVACDRGPIATLLAAVRRAVGVGSELFAVSPDERWSRVVDALRRIVDETPRPEWMTRILDGISRAP